MNCRVCTNEINGETSFCSEECKNTYWNEDKPTHKRTLKQWQEWCYKRAEELRSTSKTPNQKIVDVFDGKMIGL